MGNTTRITSGHLRRTSGAAIIVGALVLAGCGGSGDEGASSATVAAPLDRGLAAGDVATGDGSRPGVSTEPNGGGLAEGTDLGFEQDVIGRDVIVEMRVSMSSDDIQHAVATITASATAVGGGIASSDVDYGNRSGPASGSGHAVLVIKVPPRSVARLLDGLSDAGVVQSINQSAQDVTDQLVDLDVRITNARQSVSNVRGFMDRTTNLSELVTLEGELTRRQTELERLEAQQRNLGDRVEFATVTVDVVPTAAIPEPPPAADDTIGDAFRTGWDAFVGVLFVIGFVLAISLPFLTIALVVLLGAWLAVRPRRPRSTPDHHADAAVVPAAGDAVNADDAVNASPGG
jgi:hypothetical protein